MKTDNELNFSSDVLETDFHFNDLFVIEDIQRMQDLFSNAMDIASIITTPDGIPITKPSNFCSFCDIIRKTEKGLNNCLKSDAMNCCSVSSGIQINPCLSAGLLDIGVKVSIEGIHVVNWVIGQVRDEKIDIHKIIEYGNEIGANKDEYLEALSRVPVMTREKLQKIFDILFVMSNDYSDKVFKNYQFKKQLEEQKITNELLHKSEESLTITLNSIGDGVISTDKFGSIVNMNPVAENMCGLKFSETWGKKFIDVFNIIHVETRQKVENPVKKVLEKGIIIGLANHTVLLSKDGTEYHIAYNAAPIKNINGENTGVVLVFSDITEKYKAEEKIIASENLLKQSQSIARLGTYTFDILNNIWISSDVLDSIFGISGDHDKSFEGWKEIIHPDWKENIADYFIKDVIGNTSKFDKEYQIIRKNDSQVRWVHGLGELIFNSSNQPIKLIGIIQDITDRKIVLEQLEISQAKYRSIFENLQDVFYQVDLEGNFLELSSSISDFADYNRDEIIGSSIEMLYARISDRKKALENLLKNNQVRDYEVEFKTKHKITKHASLNATLIYDSNGKPDHIDGFIRDITKRKLAENAFHESEEKFHDYIEFAPHGVFVANESGKYIEVNSAATFITGYSKEELLSMNQVDLIANESKKLFVNHFERAVKEGFASDEFGIERKDTSKRFVVVDTVKLSDYLYLGFVVDQTSRKKAEVSLKENEEFLKKTQLIANLGHCILDFTTKTWKSSDISDLILGLEPNFEKSFSSLRLIIHPDDINILGDYFMNELVKNKGKFDKKFKIIRPIDQVERWIHVIGELKHNVENNPLKLIATVQDITERKLASEALRSSEELHRSILNASPDSIILVDMEGRIQMASPAALILYGCKSSDQLIGNNMFDFLAPEDRERAYSNSLLMMNGYMGTIEYRIVREDGEIFFAEVNGDIIRDSDSKPNGMVFIIRDSTDRKKADHALKSSQQELKEFASHLQNVREEEKLQLAREIHDELGQILIAIKIDLGLMKQKVLKSIKTVDAENILTNFDNLFGLVDNTLNTTRKIMTDLRPEVLFLIGFVEAVKLYINNFKDRYQILCVFENTITNLKLNSQQSVALYRIIQESFTNIAKHSRATKVIINLSLANNRLVLEVKDNGIGFKISQRNKPDSYGLIGMKERVYLLEGELLISSQPEKGTSIKVDIPYLN